MYYRYDPKNSFVIQNHQELLDDWGYALKNKMSKAIGLRHLYPDEQEEIFLKKLRNYYRSGAANVKSGPIAVGGHLGCQLLGLGRSNVRQARLYSDRSIEDLLQALDLVIDKSESPQMSLVVQAGDKPVLRSVVQANGIPVCDILQCYFDIRFSYARGKEQSDYIYEHILQPHFEGRH